MQRHYPFSEGTNFFWKKLGITARDNHGGVWKFFEKQTDNAASLLLRLRGHGASVQYANANFFIRGIVCGNAFHFHAESGLRKKVRRALAFDLIKSAAQRLEMRGKNFRIFCLI